ncbi:MAG: Drug/metabolite transporter [candidate division WS6 bacterium GW2011_GWF2_39_15]|uniref:Drug/metabolite transporter n=1 Tax=candidate division WS6 bacterium GW2011_GWF2_39_15 TaxID=1619100 RepID=A0A0G0Q550_9BACT|nr:MAG: Drug/metabolite transporter [candidate division WS6 bacterium GW2011_GWF2_39_15]
MYPILLALGASFFFGFENVFIKLNVQKNNKASLLMARSLIGFFISLILAYFFRQDLELWPVIITVILAAISFFAFVFYYKAIDLGNPSITAAIAVSRLVLITIIGVFILKYALGYLSILWIVMIITGVVLLTVDFKKLKSRGKIEKAAVNALISTALFGIAVGFFSYPIKLIGPYNVQMFYTLSLIIFAALYMIYREKESIREITLNMIKSKGIFLTGLFGCLGGLSFTIALNFGNPNILNPISSCSPIITAIISYFLFREKLTFQKYIGILITTLGVILLGYFK